MLDGLTRRERIERAVFGAVDELNKQLPAGVLIGKSFDAVLYGKQGHLESLDFLTFIMEVEERIKAEFGIDLVLTNDNLLSDHDSQFRSVGTLIDHLDSLIKNETK